jgi:hypothetical protein
MLFSPRLGLLVKFLDVGLELLPVDSPHPAPPDLYRRQIARTDQRVHLRNADAQIGGYVLEREEAGLDLGSGLFGRRLPWHGPRIPADEDGYMDLGLFAAV